jgi:hypothetical protein
MCGRGWRPYFGVERAGPLRMQASSVRRVITRKAGGLKFLVSRFRPPHLNVVGRASGQTEESPWQT